MKNYIIFLALFFGAFLFAEKSEKKNQELLQQAKSSIKNKNIKEACSCLEQIIASDSKCVQAYELLGTLLFQDEERIKDAFECFQKVVELQPVNVTALFNYGLAGIKVGHVEDALWSFKKVVELEPQHTSALYNVGYVFKVMGYIEEALFWYNKILEIEPEHENTHFAISRSYLKKGDFEIGWKLYERYLKRTNRNAEKLRELLKKESLEGYTIVVTPEGGYGDTIQFIRYAQLLKQRGATVIALVQKPLISLLSGCDYIDKLVAVGQECSQFHATATLMTLPALFNSTEQTIPRNIPYVFPKKERSEYWKDYLEKDKNFKIGICWGASVANDVSRLPIALRGIPLAQLGKVALCDNVSVYSLQKCDDVDQLDALPKGIKIHTFDNDFDETHGSFVDTAAVMQHLDLLITIDSAVAHLAGALGKKVWLLLPYETDWRWIVGRTDSPWYPTMTIFKQPQPFDWDSVMWQVLNKLQQ